MPYVTLRRNGQVYRQEVNAGSNLVVLAGIRKFPYLNYGCGMGKCTKCAVEVVAGGDRLTEPNWKERKMLGDKLVAGYRLACQLHISDDIEIKQDS
ncbi:(2Fe-2S)-binding protein [Paenibacillus antri]|uniref:(2Fe-2S)-binding protein n=1 Tax=Paenibacillus antri TaxID=2582848 RepID=A0A5R9GNG4_9BACL|nr:2Fe-2S iron-sulfur cluster-binding protein [Paenibacillus antri]TLS53615.1 (2Fe-2S)-binding protein [Paenibacillus antri]